MRLALAMVSLAFVLVTLAAASLTNDPDRPINVDSPSAAHAGVPLAEVASAALQQVEDLSVDDFSVDESESQEIAGLERPRMLPGEPQVVRSGNILWISGQLGRDASGWGDGPTEQSRLALDNLAQTLGEHGATLEDVVEFTTYHRDLGDVSVFSEVKRRIFGSTEAAWTAVGVSNLVHPEMLLELKAVAVLR